jgi:hypothetical protein
VWGGSHRPDERPHGVASHDLLHQAAVMRTKQSFSFLFFPFLSYFGTFVQSLSWQIIVLIPRKGIERKNDILMR